MKLTFLVPPVLDHNKPAERTAGCTRIVYAAPNIYELTVVAVLEQEGYTPIYRDFVYYKTSRKKFEKFLKEDDSDIYYIWTVNPYCNKSDSVNRERFDRIIPDPEISAERICRVYGSRTYLFYRSLFYR